MYFFIFFFTSNRKPSQSRFTRKTHKKKNKYIVFLSLNLSFSCLYICVFFMYTLYYFCFIWTHICCECRRFSISTFSIDLTNYMCFFLCMWYSLVEWIFFFGWLNFMPRNGHFTWIYSTNKDIYLYINVKRKHFK